MKKIKIFFTLFTFILLLFCIQRSVYAAYPNLHGKSLTTPVAWGNAYGTIFMGAAYTDPGLYTPNSDGALAIGLGVGDPFDNIGIQTILIAQDISDFGDRFALNAQAFRSVGNGAAIGVGVENINIVDDNPDRPADSDESYYLVFSQGVGGDAFVNYDTNRSKLHYSVGVGSGRFGEKSEKDVFEGKGKDGTYVFCNVSYELFDAFNVIADWNGVNLNAGISRNFLISDSVPFVITLGAADLTDNSGDGVRFIASVGTGFRL